MTMLDRMRRRTLMILALTSVSSAGPDHKGRCLLRHDYCGWPSARPMAFLVGV